MLCNYLKQNQNPKIIDPSYFKSLIDLMVFMRKPIVNWQSYGWLFDFFKKIKTMVIIYIYIYIYLFLIYFLI